jgi:hypothetical protein
MTGYAIPGVSPVTAEVAMGPPRTIPVARAKDRVASQTETDSPSSVTASTSPTAHPSPAPKPFLPRPATVPELGKLTKEAIGRVIFEAERHLVAWTGALVSTSPNKAETLGFTASSFSLMARRDQGILEREAISGAPRNRGIASAALGFTHDPAVLHLIINNVSSPDHEVCGNALLGLAILAAPETPLHPILEVVMRDDNPAAVRLNAAYALQKIALATRNDAEGLLSACVAPLLQDPLANVRATAASTAGLAGAMHLAPSLGDLLSGDTDPLVRTASAFALGEMSAMHMTDVLARALEDPDSLVVGATRGALTKMYARDYGPEALPWLKAMRRAAATSR